MKFKSSLLEGELSYSTVKGETKFVVTKICSSLINQGELFNYDDFYIESFDMIELSERTIYLPGKRDYKNLPVAFYYSESQDSYAQRLQVLLKFIEKNRKKYHLPEWL